MNSSNDTDKLTTPNKISLAQIIQTFAPGWFASIMGTGMLAILSFNLGKHFESSLLTYLAWGFFWINITLATVFSIPWLLRWILYRKAAYMTLNHPIQMNFYPTFSIGLLVLASQIITFGYSSDVAKIVWWIGALSALLFNIVIMSNLFLKDIIKAEHITPANYIPAVGLVVIPIAGIQLLSYMTGLERELALLLNILGLGAGSVIYVGILSLTFFKYFFYKPSFGILTPTAWIQIAPIGVIPVSLMNLFGYLNISGTIGMSQAIGIIFYGMGFWWLIIVIILTISAIRASAFPFALTWWACIFPLGALTNLSFRLAETTEIKVFYTTGMMVYGLMLLIWIITFIRTSIGVTNGSIFSPHPTPQSEK